VRKGWPVFREVQGIRVFVFIEVGVDAENGTWGSNSRGI